MRASYRAICIWSTAVLCACGSPPPEKEAAADSDGPALPVVTDERTDLVLSWFADGGASVAGAVAEVPEEARREVRVQDPSIPPEASAPDYIFLTDLTAKKPDGRYPVRAVKRDAYEAKRRAAAEKARAAEQQAAAQSSGLSPGGETVLDLKQPPLVMYATKHCPVCVKARRWLLEQKIPYIEKDLDSDPEAAAALQKQGAEQGVPVRGVPVFSVFGRLVPGFDPGTITSLLQQGAARLQKI